MKKLFILFVLGGLVFSCASKPTSKIPDRREFPVSQTVNPCDDFFQYACSEAISSFKLRDDRSRHIFAFNDSAERILEAKKEFLGDLSGKSVSSKRTQQLKDYYKSCIDTTARKTEEKSVVKKAVEEMAGITTKKQFADFMAKKTLLGQDGHVGYGNIANLDNSNIYDFIIMPERMTTMPEKSYYKNEALMKEFKNIATDFYRLVGYDRPAERALWLAKFETEYINNYPTPAERRKIWSMRKYTTNAKLIKKTPHLALNKILAKVPRKTKVRNPMDSTFTYLNKAIGKYKLEQLKSIYLFQTVSGKMDEAYPEFFKRRFAFNNKFLGGPPKRPDLKERCTRDVMARFTKEIDAELFTKFFPNFPESKFIGLLEKVRNSILEGLTNNKWLTKKAKANAIKKIKMAKFQVVKPKTEKEWNFNPIATYNAKTYLANKNLLSMKLVEKEWSELDKPVDKTRWWMGPLTVNAYYSPTDNKFVMPAGILQYPFYDPTLPEWVNMGAVGAVVGHELGHGVDDQGSKYDEKGKVRQWMTKKDIQTFKKRGEKLVKQFELAGHNGKLTLGENIGDLVGVTFALSAAQKVFPKEQTKRDVATQNFFLQYARAWCGVMRPKRREMQLKTDPHALVEARVNEQMKHQPEFARVFQCKAGDKLVLPKEDIVRIW